MTNSTYEPGRDEAKSESEVKGTKDTALRYTTIADMATSE